MKFISLDLGRPPKPKRLRPNRVAERIRHSLSQLTKVNKGKAITHQHLSSLLESGSLMKLEGDILTCGMDAALWGYVFRMRPTGSSALMLRSGLAAFLVEAGPSDGWDVRALSNGLIAAEIAMAKTVRSVYGDEPFPGGLCDAVARLNDGLQAGSLKRWYSDSVKARDSGTRTFAVLVHGFVNA